MYIEFRGFHPDKNGKKTIFIFGERINGFWVFGNLLGDSVIIPKNQDFYICNDKLEGADGLIAYDVIPETVGQFTNIKDTKDAKIYCNDIISSYTFRDYPVFSLVTFQDGTFALNWGDEDLPISCCDDPDSHTRVVSNIYENPSFFDED